VLDRRRTESSKKTVRQGTVLSTGVQSGRSADWFQEYSIGRAAAAVTTVSN
jgi:hypothetical protein